MISSESDNRSFLKNDFERLALAKFVYEKPLKVTEIGASDSTRVNSNLYVRS